MTEKPIIILKISIARTIMLFLLALCSLSILTMVANSAVRIHDQKSLLITVICLLPTLISLAGINALERLEFYNDKLERISVFGYRKKTIWLKDITSWGKYTSKYTSLGLYSKNTSVNLNISDMPLAECNILENTILNETPRAPYSNKTIMPGMVAIPIAGFGIFLISTGIHGIWIGGLLLILLAAWAIRWNVQLWNGLKE